MFKRVLVPLDGSVLAEQALPRAAAVARAAGAELHLTAVHRGFAFDNAAEAAQRSQLWNDEREYLDRLVAALSCEANTAVGHALLLGDPVEMICRHVTDVAADLVVMTTHARTG